MRWSRAILGLLSAGLLGLLGGAACSEDLPSPTRVDKLRLLGLRAEPPEVRPGEAAKTDALVVLPPSMADADAGTPPTLSYLWLACPLPAGASAPRPCGVGQDSPLSADGGIAALPACDDRPGELCRLGDAPTAAYRPSASSVDAAGEATIVLTLFVSDRADPDAAGCARVASGNGGSPPDPDHCVIALKRLAVSSSGTPNRNPTLASFTLDGTPLDGETATFALPADGTPPKAAVSATRDPGTSEVISDGVRENVYVSWYASAGTLDGQRSVFQPNDCDDDCRRTDPPATVSTAWLPPETEKQRAYLHRGEVLFWAVVHDDRGGIGWRAGKARVR